VDGRERIQPTPSRSALTPSRGLETTPQVSSSRRICAASASWNESLRRSIRTLVYSAHPLGRHPDGIVGLNMSQRRRRALKVLANVGECGTDPFFIIRFTPEIQIRDGLVRADRDIENNRGKTVEVVRITITDRAGGALAAKQALGRRSNHEHACLHGAGTEQVQGFLVGVRALSGCDGRRTGLGAGVGAGRVGGSELL
jgi:hypothetical protein